ncbi:MAG: glutamate--cysteine ligase, partial [Gammaproteobacteria bacterium]|nr:glutamate--cysteine ligase [Gammaproteobacteria bacterium]
LDAVCYRGREPGLELQRSGKTIALTGWASELCDVMTGFADVLDANQAGNPYRLALEEQAAAVLEPDKTPSARTLKEMRAHGEGYFHFAQRMSLQHQQYFLDLPDNNGDPCFYTETVEKSLADQRALEDADDVSFDEYLKNYFAQKP